MAVVGVRVQDHCAGRGWWLRCAQEPFAESGNRTWRRLSSPSSLAVHPALGRPTPLRGRHGERCPFGNLPTRSVFKKLDSAQVHKCQPKT